jgi:hypothetical protein
MRWTGHVAHMGWIRNAYKILVRKPEWDYLEDALVGNNIRMDLREMGQEGVDCIYPAQNRDQWWVLVKVKVNVKLSPCLTKHH